ncbi:MAG: hypothetical protein ACLT0H_11425 [Lachnospiraceae bacterium]
MAVLKEEEEEKDDKISDLNIRCDYDQDGANSFRFRKPVILKNLPRKTGCDLFSGSASHVGSMAEREPDGVYCSRLRKKRDPEDEQMTVAFRTDRLNLINMETFWLSPTLYVPGEQI